MILKWKDGRKALLENTAKKIGLESLPEKQIQ